MPKADTITCSELCPRLTRIVSSPSDRSPWSRSAERRPKLSVSTPVLASRLARTGVVSGWGWAAGRGSWKSTSVIRPKSHSFSMVTGPPPMET